MRWRRWLPVMAVIVAMISTGTTASATGPAVGGPGLPGRHIGSVPPHAVAGSTAARRAAWQRLTPSQQRLAVTQFGTLIRSRLASDAALRSQLAAARAQTAHRPAPPPWKQVVSGRARALAAGPSLGRPTFTRSAPPRPSAVPTVQSNVVESDGLDSGFKAAVADAFTPVYHVSAGENPGTGFATFLNAVPQNVAQVFGPVPPISYFRVQPLGFGTNSAGTPVSVLRIDYLTLWNQDDGFHLGGICGAAIDLVQALIGQDLIIGGHYLDNERSAALVAAPVPASGGYNPDPNAYQIYSYYTAAHEGNPFGDNSTYYNFSPPVPANNHITLALSLSKHSTYTFNPDGFPVILPGWQALTYSAIDSLYFAGIIGYDSYLVYLFLADQAFYACVVERFSDQGGFFAGTRIDVGEPDQPINGAGFIQDAQSGILQKLTVPLWG